MLPIPPSLVVYSEIIIANSKICTLARDQDDYKLSVFVLGGGDGVPKLYEMY